MLKLKVLQPFHLHDASHGMPSRDWKKTKIEPGEYEVERLEMEAEWPGMGTWVVLKGTRIGMNESSMMLMYTNRPGREKPEHAVVELWEDGAQLRHESCRQTQQTA